MDGMYRNKKNIIVVCSQPQELAEIKKEMMDHFDVDLAASSDDALSILYAANISAIVIYVGSDHEEAFSIFSHLIECLRDRSIPVIFLAERGNSEDETAAFEMGAVDYTVKRRDAADALAKRILLRIRAGENERHSGVQERRTGEQERRVNGDGLPANRNDQFVNDDGLLANRNDIFANRNDLFANENDLLANENDLFANENDLVANEDSQFESNNVESILAGKTILVVDDIDLNRGFIAAMLSDCEGLTLEFAKNGKEAVENFEKEPDKFSLILMDVQMPVMDGLEATERIRRLRRGAAKDVPIIAVTADTRGAEIERYLKAGMNGYIQKPMDFDELYAIISSHCT